MEKLRLRGGASAVFADSSVGAEHSVAGDQDRQRVGRQRAAGGADGVRVAGLRRDVAVRAGRAVGDLGGGLEHPPAELPGQ